MILGTIRVEGVRAIPVVVKHVPKGIKKAKVRFEYADPMWDGLSKTVVFRAGDVTKDVLNAGELVDIPPEVVTEVGEILKVGVYGEGIPTLWADLGRIRDATDPSGDESTDPSLPVWAQLLLMVGDLKSLNTTAKENLVAAVNEVLQKGGGTADPEEIREIVDKYLAENPPKVDLKGVVKSVNGETPDENGNVKLEIPDSGGNVDYAAYGLPILHLAGDTSAMTKDNAVDLAYVYGERNGTCSVKWQGSSSLAYDKKNYTIKFDNAFEAATGWGAQKKYCFKANYIDHSHARNIVNAKLWGQIVKSRENVPERLKNLVNGGAIDGFPCIIMLNGEFHGLYTWNIPKDGWMLGMGNSNSATTQTGALVNIETEKDAALRVSADAADTVTLVHHGKNYFPGFVDTINRVGITFTPNEDKTATFSGTNNGGATVYIDTHYNNGREFFLPAGLYYLSGNVPNQSDGVAFYVIGSTGAVARLSGELYGYRFRLDEGQVLKANFSIPGGVTVEGDVWIQIEAVETGGEATDFEPSQRTDVEVSLPVSVDALNGTNILYTTTGDVLTVNAGGNEYEAIVCASGNSAGHAIEGFKQTVSEWDTGFDLEYIADESDEGKATAMQSLNNLITACINSDGTDLDAIGTMLDWDSAIDYYIFATMIAGHDMQLKNYLLYTFNGTKWYFGGYDMDCTYGLNWNGGSWVAAHYPARFDTMAVGHRLFELIKNYKKAEVKARYAVIKQNVMSENNVYLMFSNFIGKIPSQVYLEDAKRWPMIPNTSVNNISQILNYYRMRLAGCDIWVESNHR